MTLVIEVPAELGPKLEPLRAEAERTVAQIPGVEAVTAVLTASNPTGTSATPTPGQPRQGQPQQAGPRLSGQHGSGPGPD